MTICRKLKIGYREFIRRFTKNIALKIKKRDGKVVTLDFPRPNLVATPDAFANQDPIKDPLAVKD
jgi:hypothetical protein